MSISTFSLISYYSFKKIKGHTKNKFSRVVMELFSSIIFNGYLVFTCYCKKSFIKALSVTFCFPLPHVITICYYFEVSSIFLHVYNLDISVLFSLIILSLYELFILKPSTIEYLFFIVY